MASYACKHGVKLMLNGPETEQGHEDTRRSGEGAWKEGGGEAFTCEEVIRSRNWKESQWKQASCWEEGACVASSPGIGWEASLGPDSMTLAMEPAGQAQRAELTYAEALP